MLQVKVAKLLSTATIKTAALTHGVLSFFLPEVGAVERCDDISAGLST